MIADLRPYPAMKDSGVEWFGEVPAHWEVQRIRTIAELRVSNVDKHTKKEELPIRLSNYVDVYKNDRITQGMSFMSATASRDEVERFRLKRDDVLITKDSEAWDDIGVPALVTEPADDLLCGYHLALLRPLKQMLGAYLARSIQSKSVAYQFHVEAKGVTRYGLTHAGIQSVRLPLPPLPEQAAIVRFLDHADRRIQRYIRAKQKLSKLLEEQKQAIIHQAVTGQIDVRTGQPYPAYKDSGVEWLGEVPEHWEVRRLKYFYREVDEQSSSGAEELMSVSHKTGVTPRKKNVTMFLAETNVGYKLCRPGDVVINTMWAYMAALGVARQNGLVSPSYGVYRPSNHKYLNQDYIDPLLRTEVYRIEYWNRSTGITASRLRLYPESFLGIPLLCPPFTEQTAIVEYVDKTIADIDSAFSRTRRQIFLLQEYRTRLIADVVTGKLDVRNVDVSTPMEDPALDQNNDFEEETEPNEADVTEEVYGDN